MQARYEFVEKLKEEVKAKLKTVVQDQGRYTELTKKLIVQVGLVVFRPC
jgi:V-type H+-transporting ATPase subunit E